MSSLKEKSQFLFSGISLSSVNHFPFHATPKKCKQTMIILSSSNDDTDFRCVSWAQYKTQRQLMFAVQNYGRKFFELEFISDHYEYSIRNIIIQNN